MKKFMILVILLISGNTYSLNFFDIKSELIFESVDVKNKKIKLSGQEFNYDLMIGNNVYYTKDYKQKKLSGLRKGEKLFVTIRVPSIVASQKVPSLLKEKIIYIGKNRESF